MAGIETIAVDGDQPADASRPPGGESLMEIHKPKPFHNLKEFASEILVIVIGILIALGLEQAIETMHLSERTNRARALMKTELTELLITSKEITDTHKCAVSQLQAMRDALSVGDYPRAKTLAKRRALIPARLWSDGGWSAMLSSQVVDQMGQDELWTYARIYSIVRFNRELESKFFTLDSSPAAIAEDVTSNSAEIAYMQIKDISDMIATVDAMNVDSTLILNFSRELLHIEITPAEYHHRVFGRGAVDRCRAAAKALDQA